jgi:hypothetical protein
MAAAQDPTAGFSLSKLHTICVESCPSEAIPYETLAGMMVNTHPVSSYKRRMAFHGPGKERPPACAGGHADNPVNVFVVRSVYRVEPMGLESRHLERRPTAAARLVLEVSAGWVSPSARGLSSLAAGN